MVWRLILPTRTAQLSAIVRRWISWNTRSTTRSSLSRCCWRPHLFSNLLPQKTTQQHSRGDDNTWTRYPEALAKPPCLCVHTEIYFISFLCSNRRAVNNKAGPSGNQRLLIIMVCDANQQVRATVKTAVYPIAWRHFVRNCAHRSGCSLPSLLYRRSIVFCGTPPAKAPRRAALYSGVHIGLLFHSQGSPRCNSERQFSSAMTFQPGLTNFTLWLVCTCSLFFIRTATTSRVWDCSLCFSSRVIPLCFGLERGVFGTIFLQEHRVLAVPRKYRNTCTRVRGYHPCTRVSVFDFQNCVHPYQLHWLPVLAHGTDENMEGMLLSRTESLRTAVSIAW